MIDMQEFLRGDGPDSVNVLVNGQGFTFTRTPYTLADNEVAGTSQRPRRITFTEVAEMDPPDDTMAEPAEEVDGDA